MTESCSQGIQIWRCKQKGNNYNLTNDMVQKRQEAYTNQPRTDKIDYGCLHMSED